jgi:hypothetical protein
LRERIAVLIAVLIIIGMILCTYIETSASRKKLQEFQFHEDPYEIKKLRKPIVMPIREIDEKYLSC